MKQGQKSLYLYRSYGGGRRQTRQKAVELVFEEPIFQHPVQNTSMCRWLNVDGRTSNNEARRNGR